MLVLLLIGRTQIRQVIGCRCGINSRRKTSRPPGRKYLNTRRCACIKRQDLCSESCNCHGKCGGKDCGGFPKINSGKRRGRKRALHHVQKIRKQPSSRLFLESKNTSVSPEKVNILEYVVVCAIIQFLETTHSVAQIIDVEKYYGEIVNLILLHKIPLPLHSRSFEDLQYAVKKTFAVRKTIS